MTGTARIRSAEVLVASPARNFVTLRITTDDGVVGLGDATLNGRELAVAAYLRDHVVPLLVGSDAHRIEDTWQLLYRSAYWRRGPVTMTFDLHNRHTYSAELVKLKQAYRKYTATVGVLSMDNTLVDRAVVLSEFRTEKDLFDRIGGGAGPGGVKAVAPSGAEPITIELPADIGE